mmetsp:Transcript_52181/g.127422  ORF Transcript_52181/g.127422 Transcript_52181/m.127422 type:complete len:207 (-) Transcript_52181:321-941(-)
MHAHMMSAPPSTVLAPMCSWSMAAAKAVPHSGSVEKSSVVSAEESAPRARVSRNTVSAVVTSPVHSSAVMTRGLLKTPSHTSAEGSPCCCARHHDTDIAATTLTWSAARGPVWPGCFFIAASVSQNPAPKARGWTRARRSPIPGADDAPSSSTAAPATAREAAPHAPIETFFPLKASMSGHTMTARLQRKAAVEASAVCRLSPCAM